MIIYLDILNQENITDAHIKTILDWCTNIKYVNLSNIKLITWLSLQYLATSNLKFLKVLGLRNFNDK